MAETRIRISKQLQKAAAANYLMLSDTNSEASWVAPPSLGSGTNKLFVYNTSTGWTSLGIGANLSIVSNDLVAASGLIVQDEGTNLTSGSSTLNFSGTGIAATYDSGNTRYNITLDADLNAIASLTGTGFLKRTDTNAWALDTSTYLTAESDTLATVTGRGASTSTAVTFTGGATLGSTGLKINGSTSGTATIVTPAVASSPTLTLPTATGTIALTSDIPTVNNGTLTLNIGAAGSTNTTVTVGTGTGFSANASSNSTYSLSVGPAITALATLMTTGGAGFIKRGATADTYTIDTNTYLTGNQSISISGDVVSTSGTTALTITLANTGVTANTYNNSATAVTPFTVDAKGRITSTGAAVTITPAWSSITSKPTTLSGFGITDALPLAGGTLTGSLTLAADPTGDLQAATKRYVDSVAQGLDVKQSVKVATTANITLSGTQTIDTIALSAGDRVLVKDQTTATQNGIYVVAAGAWTRATDLATGANAASAFTFVEQGSTNAESGWVCTSDTGSAVVGTNSLAFSQFSGAGQINAGNGLTKTGNTIDVVGTTNRISVGANSIDIDANYIGQSSITTVGTITNGTWSASTIAVNKGGTGLASYAAGDLIYASNSSTLAKLAKGTDGQILSLASGIPAWVDNTSTITEGYVENQSGGTVDVSAAGVVKSVDGITNAPMTITDPVKFFIYRNGMLLSRGSGRDYTISSNVITLTTALATDEILRLVKIA